MQTHDTAKSSFIPPVAKAESTAEHTRPFQVTPPQSKIGDGMGHEATEATIQARLNHAARFGHDLTKPQPQSLVQRQMEPDLDKEDEEEKTLQRQIEPGSKEDEEEEQPLQRQVESRLKEDEEEEAPIQPKLTMGQPGDKYEQEADAMAQRVMAMQDDEVQARVQSGPGTPKLQTKGTGHTVPAGFEQQLASKRGGGSPLSNEIRAFMEPRFGADFSGVRVHETPDLANAIQAQAFTHGQDIYFNSGKYNPGSSGGKELLAHELTHTLQQAAGNIQLQQGQSQKEVDSFWDWYEGTGKYEGKEFQRLRKELEPRYKFCTRIAVGTKENGKPLFQSGHPGKNTLVHEVAWSVQRPDTKWLWLTTDKAVEKLQSLPEVCEPDKTCDTKLEAAQDTNTGEQVPYDYMRRKYGEIESLFIMYATGFIFKENNEVIYHKYQENSLLKNISKKLGFKRGQGKRDELKWFLRFIDENQETRVSGSQEKTVQLRETIKSHLSILSKKEAGVPVFDYDYFFPQEEDKLQELEIRRSNRNNYWGRGSRESSNPELQELISRGYVIDDGSRRWEEWNSRLETKKEEKQERLRKLKEQERRLREQIYVLEDELKELEFERDNIQENDSGEISSRLKQKLRAIKLKISGNKNLIKNKEKEIKDKESEIDEYQKILDSPVPEKVKSNPNAVEVDLEKTGVKVKYNPDGSSLSRSHLTLDPRFALGMVEYLLTIKGMGVTEIFSAGFNTRNPMSPSDTHPQGMAADIKGFCYKGEVIALRSGNPMEPSSSKYNDIRNGHSDWFDNTHFVGPETHQMIIQRLAGKMSNYFGQIIGPGANEAHMNHFHVQVYGLRGKEGALDAPATKDDPKPWNRRKK